MTDATKLAELAASLHKTADYLGCTYDEIGDELNAGADVIEAALRERDALATQLAAYKAMAEDALQTVRWVAERHTIAETLDDNTPMPWRGLLPEERIADIRRRKEVHDAAVLHARELLTRYQAMKD